MDYKGKPYDRCSQFLLDLIVGEAVSVSKWQNEKFLWCNSLKWFIYTICES